MSLSKLQWPSFFMEVYCCKKNGSPKSSTEMYSFTRGKLSMHKHKKKKKILLPQYLKLPPLLKKQFYFSRVLPPQGEREGEGGERAREREHVLTDCIPKEGQRMDCLNHFGIRKK